MYERSCQGIPEASVTLQSECHSQPALSCDRQTRTMEHGTESKLPAYCQCIQLE